MNERVLTAPWRAIEIPGGFAVEDANGIRLAHIYADTSAGSVNRQRLTWDEARRIARQMARVPELMSKIEQT